MVMGMLRKLGLIILRFIEELFESEARSIDAFYKYYAR